MIWIIHNALFVSLLFRVVSSMNHMYLLLFMLSKANVTLLRQFLGFYCLSKLMILIIHNAFFVSLLFRVVSSMNHMYLLQLMLSKVNVTLLRQFLVCRSLRFG